MVKSDYNYRPNPNRAIYVTRIFDEDLAAKLLPEIIALRATTSEPLTAFINSRGGSIRTLNTIHGALICKDADGKRCRLITIALGEAGSAAATLLVMGDYAICQPHTTVHFHGARLSDVDVTMEGAFDMVAELAILKRRTALRMAKQSIGRIVRRYVQTMPKFEDETKTYTLDEFTANLSTRTTGPADRVLERTLENVSRANFLSEKVVPRAKFKISDTQLKQDVAVFKALLDFELKQNGYDRLDDDAVAEISNRYSLIHDYQLGDHYWSMSSILRQQGPYLLKPNDLTEFETTVEDQERPKVVDWLNEKIGYILRVLWHFAVVMCRELQTGENRLTSQDAYWLGLVDEVTGSLDGERADVETEIIAAPPSASPTASPQPS